LHPAGKLRDARKQQQHTKNSRKTASRNPRVQKCPYQTSHGTRDSESKEHTTIDVTTQDPETLRCGDEMGDRYRRNSDLGAAFEREHGREDTADAEAGDGSDAAGDNRRESDGEAENHLGCNRS
jgi:hypothetical protein